MPPFDYNRYKREAIIFLASLIVAILAGFALGYDAGSQERSYAEFRVAVCG